MANIIPAHWHKFINTLISGCMNHTYTRCIDSSYSFTVSRNNSNPSNMAATIQTLSLHEIFYPPHGNQSGHGGMFTSRRRVDFNCICESEPRGVST